MAHLTHTRKELRRRVAALLFVSRNDYIYTEADGTHSSTTVELGKIANLFDTDQFYRGHILLRAGDADAEMRYITEFDGATGIATVNTAWDTNPVDGDEVEIYAAPIDIEQIHQAINAALSAESFNFPLTGISDLQVINSDQRTLDVPSGWVSVNKVKVDCSQVYGDRQTSRISSLYRVEKTLQATTSQRGQSLRPASELPTAGVAIRLRKVGTLTGSLYARLRSDDGAGKPTGGAGGILVSSSAVDVTDVGNREWVYFPFTTPYYIQALDYVHVTLAPSSLTGLSASNYLAWCGETAASPFGNPSVSADTGATWTEETGYRLECRLVPYIPDYVSLPWAKWRIVKGTTPQVQLFTDSMNAEAYILEGQRYQTELDDDTDICYFPLSWVSYHAAADYLLAHASHSDEAQRRARDFRDVAGQYLPVSAGLVKQRLVEWF